MLCGGILHCVDAVSITKGKSKCETCVWGKKRAHSGLHGGANSALQLYKLHYIDSLLCNKIPVPNVTVVLINSVPQPDAMFHCNF